MKDVSFKYHGIKQIAGFLLVSFCSLVFASNSLQTGCLSPKILFVDGQGLDAGSNSPLLLDLSIPFAQEVREDIDKNNEFVLLVKNPDFEVDEYSITARFKKILSDLKLKDSKKMKELQKICYIIDQLEKVSLLMAQAILKDVEAYYMKKYGVIIHEGLNVEDMQYVLFELLRNSFVHANSYNILDSISVGWNIEDDKLKFYIGDKRGGWLHNKIFYKLGITRFLDEVLGNKKRFGSIYLEKILKVAGANLGLRLSGNRFDIKIKKFKNGKIIEATYNLAKLSSDFIEKNNLALKSA